MSYFGQFLSTFKFGFICVLFLAVTANYDDYNLDEYVDMEDYNFYSPKIKKEEEVDKKCNKCGIGNPAPNVWNVGRIISGKPVTPVNKYPWIVALIAQREKIFCGGAFVSANFVITAGHCVFRKNRTKDPECSGRKIPESCFLNNKDLRVSFRGNKVKGLSDSLEVSKIVSHPLFQYGMREYDLALLKLSKPVQCSSMASPVCLPTKDPHKVGQTLVIAGWGFNTPEGRRDRETLREGGVKEALPRRCLHPNKRGSKMPNIVCGIGTEAKQTPCDGDTGTSIFGNMQKKYYAVGIVSDLRHSGCNVKSPEAYAKIFSSIAWIKSHVKDLPKP